MAHNTHFPSLREIRQLLPPITLDGVDLPAHDFIFVPQYPLSHRDVVQAWHRNRARLLLLVDRQGSMTPLHRFIDQVCAAIQQSGRLANVAQFYFHDVPAEGADETILENLPDNQLFPTLDPIIDDIKPLTEGVVYADSELLSPQPLQNVLEKHANGAAVVLISDAGAARGNYDTLRLLDTIAFLKALRPVSTRYVWLNPLPRRYWTNSTAAQIARHLPMFPLDKAAIYQAVNVLRGQPYLIEKPI